VLVVVKLAANPDGLKSCFDTCDHVQAQQSSNHFVSYGWE
jgi:hypothetical protein